MTEPAVSFMFRLSCFQHSLLDVSWGRESLGVELIQLLGYQHSLFDSCGLWEEVVRMLIARQVDKCRT